VNVAVAVHRVDQPLAVRAPAAAVTRRSAAFRSGPSKFRLESMWEDRGATSEFERRAEPAGYTAPLEHTVTRRKVAARVRPALTAPRLVPAESPVDHVNLPVLRIDPGGQIISMGTADSDSVGRYLASGSSTPTFGPSVILRLEGSSGAAILPPPLAA
jgi:hypothetical protein